MPVDFGDLIDPLLTLAMIQVHDLVVWPVKVVCDVGYLLEQPIRGVAYCSPDPSTSVSNISLHLGHMISTRAWPFSLIR